MISANALPPGALLDHLRSDPYPLYAQLREAGPVVWLAPLQRWAVTGHAEVLRVLKEGEFSAERQRAAGEIVAPPRRTMLVSDPPDHTRLRTLVQKAFTPRVVEQLRPRIERRVELALDQAAERGSMDVIEDFAYPLPVMVIAEMLGVPPEDHEMFKAGSAAIAAALDPIASPEASKPSPGRELEDYLAGIIAARRTSPGDDLISRLVEAEEAGDRLDPVELLQMCTLLLVAGHETTVNLIGNGVNTLLDHPGAARRLREEPELTERALEELLRFDSPVQMTGRIALSEVDLAGHRVQPGQLVMTLIGAANRDPGVFADPERLDITRHPNPHIGFGRGIHFCLGAPLARLEGQIAIGSLLRRFPSLERDGEPRRRPTITLRGFVSLPLRVA